MTITKRLRYSALIGAVSLFLFAAIAFSPEIGLVGVGEPAPDFDAINVRTGEQVGLDAYAGKVVLINIWATWCGPCKEEMPSMQRLYEQLDEDGFEIAAVSIDIVGSDEVLAFADEYGLTFDILHDQPGKINRTYQVTGYPESFLVDRFGTIVKKVIGPLEWDAPENVALVERLLREP